MKQITLLLFITPLIFSCDKSDNGCTCKGEFGTMDGGTFYSNNVDCDNGSPAIDYQNGNAYFKGCVD